MFCRCCFELKFDRGDGPYVIGYNFGKCAWSVHSSPAARSAIIIATLTDFLFSLSVLSCILVVVRNVVYSSLSSLVSATSRTISWFVRRHWRVFGEGEPPRATAVLLLELLCVSALCSVLVGASIVHTRGLASSLSIHFVNTYIPYMTYPICSPARVRVRLFSSDFPQGILFFFPSTFFLYML